MKIFTKKTRILIIDDRGPVLERIQGRIEIFWPPDIPVKILAMYCAWGNEAIEGIQEIQPDILVLCDTFRKDEAGGREVARWIDENYRVTMLVAVYSDRPQDEVRRSFAGVACVKYFICGDYLRDFVEYCLSKRTAEGVYFDR